MPNTPSLWGAARLGLRVWVGCASDGFSFGCEIVALLLLTGSVGVSVLQPEINMACPMLYSERRVGFF